MFLLLLLPSILVILLVSLILYARWNYGSLETLNIPVVKPHFILGSTYDVHLVQQGFRDVEWMRKYGPIYGVYEGREAQVHVNDAEMLRHIMVKDYDHFNARRTLDFGDPILNELPEFLPGEKWKMVRQLMAPQLSLGKVKGMSHNMSDAIHDYISDLKKEIPKTGNGCLEDYDLRDGLYHMSTDLILRCVFNIKVGIATGTGKHFVTILKKFMSTDSGYKPSALQPWILSFPFLKKLGLKAGASALFDKNMALQFAATFKKLCDDRKRNQTKIGDFTDYIMELLEKVDTHEFKKNNVTELTLISQALVFFFAGQDQITNILTFLAYFVSRNPEIESKIVQEVDRVVEANKGVINHDCLSEFTYLTACINEVLRLYPVFFRAERLCTKDWEMDGCRIKKGMTVQIPIWAANRNPKYFENPEEFDPERFMPQNKSKLHPYALESFGHGPRNCFGMKFAYEALVLSAANIYKELRFVVKDGTEPQFDAGNLFYYTTKPMYFHVSVRS